MELFARDELFDYWECTIEPPNRRLAYVFEMISGSERVWLNEKGISLEPPHPDMALYFFEYPFLYGKDVFSAPSWVNDAVFYQIFVERFANGDPSNNPESTLPWDTLPDRETFRGGDLRGIKQRLGYLQDLGINALYLTPIFTSPSNHKYDISDYRQVDPHFGTMEELKELVADCHSRNIRVILDIVVNHCSSQFPPFQDLWVHGENSRYLDWFIVKEFPLASQPKPNYATFAFEPGMPKLNTENPELRRYLLDTIRYWMEETGIDGWRIDVANDVDQIFLREIRSEIKSINPEAFILGEIWYDGLPWLGGDQLESVMNYNLAHPIKKFFGEGAWDARAFAEHVGRQLAAYPQTVTENLFNVLDSHDTERLLHTCGGDFRRMKLALLFQFMYNGAPSIYYGNEAGMTGGYDPDCRRSMEWDPERRNRDMFGYFQWLIRNRRQWPSWRKGRLYFLQAETGSGVLGFIKKNANESFLVWMNNQKDGISLDISAYGLKGQWQDIRTLEMVDLSEGRSGVNIIVDGYGFVALRSVSEHEG